MAGQPSAPGSSSFYNRGLPSNKGKSKSYRRERGGGGGGLLVGKLVLQVSDAN